MWPDRVLNPGPLTYESGALPTALRGPAPCKEARALEMTPQQPPFHLVLLSALPVELAKYIPVHSLILSTHLFFCLPLLLFLFTVSCRIVFAKPEDLET